MHHNIDQSWRDVLAERGDAVALVDADSGQSWSFLEIEHSARVWLTAHPLCAGEEGQVWCVALSSRVEWLTVFLAAIKACAVVLPLEPRELETLRDQARAQNAQLLIHDSGVDQLLGGSSRPGFFLIKLTSGTTGAAKALPFTETEMLMDGAQIMRSMSITSQDRNYAVIPLGHSYGLGNLVMPFFMAGVPIVLASSPYPQVMVEEVTRFACTLLPLVPPLIKALASVSLDPQPMPSLRLVISAGSALKAKMAKRFYQNTGLRVHNFYGSSETGGLCFDQTGEWAEVEGAVGTSLSGVQLNIGADQSIQVRSAACCHAVYREGVCTIHDFGMLDEGGVLHLIGRHADILKIAGRRVSLSEIESVICASTGVSDAYVSSRTGRSGELRIVALYVGDLEVDTLRPQLKDILSAWQLPRYLWRVSSIRYTARGKKDRTQLEALIDGLIPSTA